MERKILRSIIENDILENLIDSTVLSVLLCDRTTGKNIIWATDDYSEMGSDYAFHSEIKPELITGDRGEIIKPRIEKDKSAKVNRVQNMAEVFTPSWICNQQNNLIDDAWFGRHTNRFNTEKEKGWQTNYHKVCFTEKTWQDYVRDTRLEITCGEAPYLTSRYDAVTGKAITVKSRIGLLDRKLRIISENIKDEGTWKKWAKIALQNTYGFEWQGDSVLLARENLLCTVIEHYFDKYGKCLSNQCVLSFAEVISWNIWQMDGLKFVVPDSCHDEGIEEQFSMFDTKTQTVKKCPGCENPAYRHNGVYACIKNWEDNEVVEFASILKKG